MQETGKDQAIYVASFGVLFIIGLVFVLTLIDCRQTSELVACSMRWGNYGLSVQYTDQLMIWLLGLNDFRVWPLRQNIPLALFWSISLMTLSLIGLVLTLLITFVDQLFKSLLNQVHKRG